MSSTADITIPMHVSCRIDLVYADDGLTLVLTPLEFRIGDGD